jgi:DNA-binding winged helix-turn-helix (wHTH) protein
MLSRATASHNESSMSQQTYLMSSLNPEFRLGSSIVSPQTNRLLSRHRTVRVDAKIMEVLVSLALHRGQVLARNQLIRTVWANTYATGNSVKRCISNLRIVLKDDLRRPQLIETIPKRCYRLLVPMARTAIGHKQVACRNEAQGNDDHLTSNLEALLFESTQTCSILYANKPSAGRDLELLSVLIPDHKKSPNHHWKEHKIVRIVAALGTSLFCSMNGRFVATILAGRLNHMIED